MHIILLSILLISQGILAKSEYFAAVVEYYPLQNRSLSPEDRLNGNAQAYINLLELASKENKIDIIVYPESTLTTQAIIRSRSDILPLSVEIPDKFTGVSLCVSKESNFLSNLACAAKKFQTYLVVNLIERSLCKGERCAENGWDYYNTNVALDRKGAVIARYRKYNLFGEYFFNQTDVHDITIFKTDFGVSFGSFTCFDILFGKPALELIKKHEIKHIIYPTMWFSELPFLTALQAQYQWNYEMDTVMLASGANNPSVGSGGTGIFLGKSHPAAIDLIGKETSKVYVASVFKDKCQVPSHDSEHETDMVAKELDDFFLKTDDLMPYESELLKISEHVNQVLCSGENKEFCCSFKVDTKLDETLLKNGKSYYRYRLVAFSGVRSFSGVYNGGVEICGIVACLDDSLASCAKRFNNYNDVSWPLKFNKISIQANFTVDDRIQFPNSLLSNIRPLAANLIEWFHKYFANGGIIERTYNLIKPQNRLMTFAIYGRDFSRDSAPFENN